MNPESYYFVCFFSLKEQVQAFLLYWIGTKENHEIDTMELQNHWYRYLEAFLYNALWSSLVSKSY